MGRFIVVEGLDGAGTTTQVARVVAHLHGRGERVLATREPTDGPVGRLIRSTLRAEVGSVSPDVLPWLFAADRADHLQRVVEPAIAAGSTIVSDRYYHSSLAYQMTSVPLDDVWALNRRFRTPDLVVFLRVPVSECLRRLEGRPIREIFEEEARLVRVAANYDVAIALLRSRGHRIVDIDGTQVVDAVTAAVLAAVDA